jgi:hypothetical protein
MKLRRKGPLAMVALHYQKDLLRRQHSHLRGQAAGVWLWGKKLPGRGQCGTWIQRSPAYDGGMRHTWIKLSGTRSACWDSEKNTSKVGALTCRSMSCLRVNVFLTFPCSSECRERLSRVPVGIWPNLQKELCPPGSSEFPLGDTIELPLREGSLNIKHHIQRPEELSPRPSVQKPFTITLKLPPPPLASFSLGK